MKWDSRWKKPRGCESVQRKASQSWARASNAWQPFCAFERATSEQAKAIHHSLSAFLNIHTSIWVETHPRMLCQHSSITEREGGKRFPWSTGKSCHSRTKRLDGTPLAAFDAWRRKPGKETRCCSLTRGVRVHTLVAGRSRRGVFVFKHKCEHLLVGRVGPSGRN